MPPIAATIATIIAAAASTSLGIYEATNQPGTPKMPTGAAPLTATQNRNQEAAVASTLPTLQSMTGGGINPEYAAQWGAGQAGVSGNQSPGNIQAAINQFFGLSAPGQAGFTPSTVGQGGGTNILDLLSRAIPGAGPGGIPVPGSQDEFKGLVA